jgi:hypothetical protein
MRTLADRVREAREEKGVSAAALDRAIGQAKPGRSGGYVSRIETGEKKNPERRILEKIAAELGVRYMWLAFESGLKRGPDTPAIPDPHVGTFLLKLDRFGGLRQWVEDHPTTLRVSELLRGMTAYEVTPPKTRSDGMPHDGWSAFFEDVLTGRIAHVTSTSGDAEAVAELEAAQIDATMPRGQMHLVNPVQTTAPKRPKRVKK